jgi:hypothetical protein
MRIVVASSVFYPRLGGVEEITDTLGRALATLSHEVKVITAEPTSGPEETDTAPYTLVRTTSFFQIARYVRESDLVIVMGPIFVFMFL